MKKVFSILLLVNIYLFAELLPLGGNSNNDFNITATINLKGNIKVIGNTVLRGTAQDDQNQLSNAEVNLNYVDVDNDNNTYNSSRATIDANQNGIDISNAKIVWAGLYWSGYLHNDTGDPGIDSNFNFTSVTNNSQNAATVAARASQEITNFINNVDNNGNNTNTNSVIFRVDGQEFNIVAQQGALNHFVNDTNWRGYQSFSYTSFADITSILKGRKAPKTYEVANIPTRSGQTWTGIYPEGLGNSGAWCLVIVYDNSSEPYEKVRNISIFNGYKVLDANSNLNNVTINLSGFRTPSHALNGVDSTLSVFASEGDRFIPGDFASITNQNNETFNLPSGNGGYFNSSIEGVNSRSPLITNNQGIDIHTIQVGTSRSDGQGVIGINQTNATINIGTTGDVFYPSMIAFATELYVPKICYDYSVKIGDYISIPKNLNDERNITVDKISNLPLQLKLLIRSKEADFDLLESALSATFTPKEAFIYKQGESKYSPPNAVVFFDATDVNISKGSIAVGRDINSSGGIIGSNETTYGKLYYDFNISNFSGKFDVNLDAKISFDGGKHMVPYTLSTAMPVDSIYHIKRCETNPVYDPVYGMLNIERGDSEFSEHDEAKRYALYTQVVGVPYEISLASYEKGADGKYNTPSKLDALIEVEVIDAGTFDNNASNGFDSICNNPDSYNSGNFIDMENKDRVKYTMEKDKNTVALRNAAFRAWIFTVKDGNNTRKLAYYPPRNGDVNDLYFKDLYDINYKNGEDLNSSYCKNDCANADANDQNLTCYQCIRSHFGMPICSRDNFSIRPQSYDIKVSDTNEDEAEKNKTVTDGNLAAGYNYKLDITATSYEANKSAIGYYFITNPQKGRISSANSNNGALCADKNNRDLTLTILNASTILMDINKSSNVLKINNAGKYKIHLEDKDWTRVDQLGYQYRPFPNNIDCEFNKTEVKAAELNARRGCLTATGRVAADTLPDKPVSMHPYKFDITSVTAIPNPNISAKYVYLSDINSSNYNNNSVRYDKRMALRIGGSVKAVGKDGTVLTNYTKGCVAQDTKVKISYTHDKQGESNGNTLVTTKGYSLPMIYYIYDYGVDGNKNPNVDVNNSVTPNSNFAQDFNKSYFLDNKKGIGIYSQYVNFKREEKNPVNPFKFTTKEFNITSPKDKLWAHLISNYIPKGHKKIDKNVTFYYAKAQPKEKEYNTYEKTINTPVGIAIYCDKKIDTICANRYDINVTYGMIFKEPFWYIATKHNASNDGKLKLSLKKDNIGSNVPVSAKIVTSSGQATSATIDGFTRGIDKDINVTRNNGVANYPYTVCVDPRPTLQNYPYLVYDSTTCLYKVIFDNVSGAWSGEGQTGNVVEYNNSGLKNNKIGW